MRAVSGQPALGLQRVMVHSANCTTNHRRLGCLRRGSSRTFAPGANEECECARGEDNKDSDNNSNKNNHKNNDHNLPAAYAL